MDQAVVMATLTFLNLGSEMTRVFMHPGTGGYPKPTEMQFLGSHENLDPANRVLYMHPVSGSYDLPVFRFNGAKVAIEETNFGAVKAMFR